MKTPNSPFTFETLLNVKMRRQHNYHKGQAALRIYVNQPIHYDLVANQEKASVIVKTDGSFAALFWTLLLPRLTSSPKAPIHYTLHNTTALV